MNRKWQKQFEILQMLAKICKALNSAIGLSVKVTLVEPKTIARSEGKAVRVIDRRPKIKSGFNLLIRKADQHSKNTITK